MIVSFTLFAKSIQDLILRVRCKAIIFSSLEISKILNVARLLDDLHDVPWENI